MNISAWLRTLQAAGQLDSSVLDAGVERIVARASALAMGESNFFVTRTATGVKISASNPTARARRALDRAVAQELPAIRASVVSAAQERLQG